VDFLWLTEEDTIWFWQEVQTLDYSAENERANDYRSRDSWEDRLFDAWGHCVLGAYSANDLGDPAAWAPGTGYEGLHEGMSWLTLNLVQHDSLTQDYFNQSVGRSIGVANPTGNYARLSFEAMINGRLDLTLAGIPRGTRLRRRAVARRSATEATRHARHRLAGRTRTA